MVDYLLHGLEPDLFELYPADNAWYKDNKVDLLCFGLRVSQDTALPSVMYEGLEAWVPPAAALSQHYVALGKLLSTPPKTHAELLQGYFRVRTESNGTHVITTIMDEVFHKTEVSLEGGTLTFENAFEWKTLVSVKNGNRVF